MDLPKSIQAFKEQFKEEEVFRLLELSSFIMAEMKLRYPAQTKEYLSLVNKLQHIVQGMEGQITDEIKSYVIQSQLFSPNEN